MKFFAFIAKGLAVIERRELIVMTLAPTTLAFVPYLMGASFDAKTTSPAILKIVAQLILIGNAVAIIGVISMLLLLYFLGSKSSRGGGDENG